MAEVLLLGLFIMLAVGYGLASFRLQVIGVSIPIVLVLGTFISPFNIYVVGIIYTYIVLTVLYNLNLRTIEASSSLRVAFIVANVINLTLGFGIILQNDKVTAFLMEHYTYWYPELLSNMFAMRKPVLSFGTHSVAGFFEFLFFWLNLKTFETRRARLYLFFAVIYAIFSIFLFSYTSLFFFACEAVMLIRLAVSWNWKLTLVASASALVLAFLFVRAQLDALEWKYELADYARMDLDPTSSGPLARYSLTGNLAPNLAYLRDNPLTPIGLSKPSTLFFMDSGPIEYLLRGSVPLLVLIYGGLFLFLRQNLRFQNDALLLFAAILVFEIGFPVLLYFRTLYLVPFIIVYLNGLHEFGDKESRIVNARAAFAVPQS